MIKRLYIITKSSRRIPGDMINCDNWQEDPTIARVPTSRTRTEYDNHPFLWMQLIRHLHLHSYSTCSGSSAWLASKRYDMSTDNRQRTAFLLRFFWMTSTGVPCRHTYRKGLYGGQVDHTWPTQQRGFNMRGRDALTVNLR